MAAPTGLTVASSSLTGPAPFAAVVTASATDPDSGPVTIRVLWPDSTVTEVDSGEDATRTFSTPLIGSVVVSALDEDGAQSPAITVFLSVGFPDGLDLLDDVDGLCGPAWFDADDMGFCPANTGANPIEVQQIVDAAIGFVNHSTCYQWIGVCTAAIRPPASESGCSMSHRSDRYRLGIDLSLAVPRRIRRIVRVVVDGQEVDPAFYRLVNNKRIVAQQTDNATNPLNPWPAQFADRPIGDVGTWYIEVEYGRLAPPALINASKRLACEMMKAFYGLECGFPDSVASVSGEGVSMSFAPRQPGQTGIPAIDMVLERFGCNTMQRRRMLDPAAEKSEVVRYL